MPMTDDEIQMLAITTCSDSLLHEGQCCVCREPATVAVLTTDFVEHTRCADHQRGDCLAVKPLVWAEGWGPRCP